MHWNFGIDGDVYNVTVPGRRWNLHIRRFNGMKRNVKHTKQGFLEHDARQTLSQTFHTSSTLRIQYNTLICQRLKHNQESFPLFQCLLGRAQTRVPFLSRCLPARVASTRGIAVATGTSFRFCCWKAMFKSTVGIALLLPYWKWWMRMLRKTKTVDKTQTTRSHERLQASNRRSKQTSKL